ncbi:hypothetical protein HMN09_00391500 [Mycena chlorophos]|uniref:Uncharacterized protein n=1 Tax=Mycena chlorophos TaxID=658473 RepID=A0A8H6TFI5_MYCCL|nr:hypothetical protein HMN09_00391500 [Mycena chlorophos]
MDEFPVEVGDDYVQGHAFPAASSEYARLLASLESEREKTKRFSDALRAEKAASSILRDEKAVLEKRLTAETTRSSEPNEARSKSVAVQTLAQSNVELQLQHEAAVKEALETQNNLRALLGQANQITSSLNDEMAKVVAHNTTLQQDLVCSQAQTLEMKAKAEKTERARASLDALLGNTRSMLDRVRGDHDKLQARFQEHSDLLKMSFEAKNDFRHRAQQLEEKSVALAKRVTELEEVKKKLEDDYEGLEKIIRQLEEEKAQLQDRVQTYVKTISLVKEDVRKELEKEWTATIHSIVRKIGPAVAQAHLGPELEVGDVECTPGPEAATVVPAAPIPKVEPELLQERIYDIVREASVPFTPTSAISESAVAESGAGDVHKLRKELTALMNSFPCPPDRPRYRDLRPVQSARKVLNELLNTNKWKEMHSSRRFLYLPKRTIPCSDDKRLHLFAFTPTWHYDEDTDTWDERNDLFAKSQPTEGGQSSPTFDLFVLDKDDVFYAGIYSVHDFRDPYWHGAQNGEPPYGVKMNSIHRAAGLPFAFSETKLRERFPRGLPVGTCGRPDTHPGQRGLNGDGRRYQTRPRRFGELELQSRRGLGGIDRLDDVCNIVRAALLVGVPTRGLAALGSRYPKKPVTGWHVIEFFHSATSMDEFPVEVGDDYVQGHAFPAASSEYARLLASLESEREKTKRFSDALRAEKAASSILRDEKAVLEKQLTTETTRSSEPNEARSKSVAVQTLAQSNVELQLQHEAAEALETQNNLRALLGQANQITASLNDEMAKVVAHNTTLQQDLVCSQAQTLEMKAKAEKTERARASLDALLGNTRSMLDRVRGDHDKLHARFQEHSDLLKMSFEAKNDFRKSVALAKRVTELEEVKKKLEDDYEGLEKTIRQQDEEKAQLQDRVQTYVKTISLVKEDVRKELEKEWTATIHSIVRKIGPAVAQAHLGPELEVGDVECTPGPEAATVVPAAPIPKVDPELVQEQIYDIVREGASVPFTPTSAVSETAVAESGADDIHKLRKELTALMNSFPCPPDRPKYRDLRPVQSARRVLNELLNTNKWKEMHSSRRFLYLPKRTIPCSDDKRLHLFAFTPTWHYDEDTDSWDERNDLFAKSQPTEGGQTSPTFDLFVLDKDDVFYAGIYSVHDFRDPYWHGAQNGEPPYGVKMNSIHRAAGLPFAFSETKLRERFPRGLPVGTCGRPVPAALLVGVPTRGLAALGSRYPKKPVTGWHVIEFFHSATSMDEFPVEVGDDYVQGHAFPAASSEYARLLASLESEREKTKRFSDALRAEKAASSILREEKATLEKQLTAERTRSSEPNEARSKSVAVQTREDNLAQRNAELQMQHEAASYQEALETQNNLRTLLGQANQITSSLNAEMAKVVAHNTTLQQDLVCSQAQTLEMKAKAEKTERARASLDALLGNTRSMLDRRPVEDEFRGQERLPAPGTTTGRGERKTSMQHTRKLNGQQKSVALAKRVTELEEVKKKLEDDYEGLEKTIRQQDEEKAQLQDRVQTYVKTISLVKEDVRKELEKEWTATIHSIVRKIGPAVAQAHLGPELEVGDAECTPGPEAATVVPAAPIPKVDPELLQERISDIVREASVPFTPTSAVSETAVAESGADDIHKLRKELTALMNSFPCPPDRPKYRDLRPVQSARKVLNELLNTNKWKEMHSSRRFLYLPKRTIPCSDDKRLHLFAFTPTWHYDEDTDSWDERNDLFAKSQPPEGGQSSPTFDLFVLDKDDVFYAGIYSVHDFRDPYWHGAQNGEPPYGVVSHLSILSEPL